MEQLKNGGEVAIIEGKAGNASGEYRKNGDNKCIYRKQRIQACGFSAG